MTDRIYYTDPGCRAFDATVVAAEPAGEVTRVRLDRTAFYPTSGGQPFDMGRLGDARVVDVVDEEGGEIVHLVDRMLPTGARVHGELDWPRRFDHMQQHTGQHLLSAAFDRLFDVRTVSFHMGAEASTIDLAREVSAPETAAAEAEASRIVWEDRPVTVRFATDDEVARMPLRKESARTGLVRLVDIADFDLSACGGTHVPSTGAVGVVAVAGWERFKGGSRVTFVCGGRALRSHAALRDVVAAATRTLSVSAGDLVTSIERLQNDARESARTIRRLQEETAVTAAENLRARAETIGPHRVVLTAAAGQDVAGLKMLASAIVSEPGLVALVVGEGSPTPVVLARSADVALDAGAWIRGAAATLGGRGGGRPEQAQAGLTAAAARILEYARDTFHDLPA
jgi:alanyl-tRNA synthetase